MIREPEWDDVERDRLLGLALYEAGICACGFPSSLTHDPSNYFQIEEKTCPVCRTADRYGRVQAKADERASAAQGDKAPPDTPRPSDGRRTFLRQLSPLEVAERREARAVGPTTSA